MPGAGLFSFDETEAFFGKQNEVRDGRDRYANIEINHLPQRTEVYARLAVLVTNHRGRSMRALQPFLV